jgi:hypothetical protein
VTSGSISSFDKADEEYIHPRVGVCRRCWQRFSDRNSFVEHINSPCEKASKSKREGWQILHDSFTPLSLKVPSDQHDSADRLNLPRLDNGSLTTEVANTPEPGAIGGVTADSNAVGTPTAETNTIGIDEFERL